MIAFRQYLKNIWRNCDDKRNASCEREFDYPPQGQGLCHWRTGYDGREKGRLSAGITNGRVFRNAQDPNDVVILQDVADVATARACLGSDDLKAQMEKNGVVGSPNVRFAVAA